MRWNETVKSYYYCSVTTLSSTRRRVIACECHDVPVQINTRCNDTKCGWRIVIIIQRDVASSPCT
jgi:hypothetical protein